MSHRSAVRSWFALTLALVTAGVAIWIVLPAPNRTLLTLAVGAPEVSAWLLVTAALAMMLAMLDARRRVVSRLSLAVSAAALALASSPLLRFQGVADSAESALRSGLGVDYLDRIAPAQRALLRSKPLIVRDLFDGRVGSTSVRISRNHTIDILADDTLTVDVYQPTGDGPYPVLVQIYGGSWQSGAPSGFAAFAEHIASLGFVVFAIDYRHAPTHRFPTQIGDVRRALSWIGAEATTWHADTSRMVLMGRSAGAHLAMLAAYAPDAPRIRGVISYYGPVDLVEGYRHPPSPDPLDVRAIEQAFLGGPPDSRMALYRAASPISLVTGQLPPTLLVYGGRDHIVEPRFGVLLAGQLRAAGNTVVHVEIPWAEHAFDVVANGPSGQLSQYVTERFLTWAVAAP